MLMRAISMVPAAMMLVTSTQTVASAEEGYESRPYYGGGSKYGDYGNKYGGYGGKYDYKVLKPFPKYANKFYGGKYYGDYGYECGTNYPQYKWYKPGSWKFNKYSKNNYYVDCNLPDEKADDEEKRDVHTPCFFNSTFQPFDLSLNNTECSEQEGPIEDLYVGPIEAPGATIEYNSPTSFIMRQIGVLEAFPTGAPFLCTVSSDTCDTGVCISQNGFRPVQTLHIKLENSTTFDGAFPWEAFFLTGGPAGGPVCSQSFEPIGPPPQK